MPTSNGLDHEEQVVVPPNALDMPIPEETNDNNNNNDEDFVLQAHIIYAIFYEVSFYYARMFPRSLRSLIEFVFLLKVSCV